MRILDKYIRRTIISATLLVSAVIIGLQSFLSLIQQFHYVGEQDYGMWQAFLFVPMQLPAQFYQLFPMAGFLGALIGLGRLSSSSQLIVIRASGVSVMRIAWSVMKAAIVMIIVVTAIGEGIGPTWQLQSEQMRHNALFPTKNASMLDSIWLHQANGFTHIAKLSNQKTMLNVTRYRFNPSGRLAKITVASSGHLMQKQWELSDLKQTIFKHDHIELRTQSKAGLHVAFQPDLQMQMSIESTAQTIMDLYRTIDYRESIGLSVNRFVFTFWQRLLQPVTTLVMICLAVPFVFGSFRSSSMGVRILSGVIIGFVFYMLNQLFGPITLVYQFPPLLAAFMPTCVFFVLMIILLLRTK